MMADHSDGSYNEFAKWYADKVKESSAHIYLEKPAMYAKLPDLEGKDVLCIGCGSGEECSYIKSIGAKRVVGIDISEGMIHEAQKRHKYIEFIVMNMSEIKFPQSSFDYVYSSLSVHYEENFSLVLDEIHNVLKDNGRFLFSTNHPVKWGAERYKDREKSLYRLGYLKPKTNKNAEVYGDYLNSRKIIDSWGQRLEVVMYHKPISLILEEIRKSKFEMIDFIEPKPTRECREKDPVFWEIHQKIPLFLIIELKKR